METRRKNKRRGSRKRSLLALLIPQVCRLLVGVVVVVGAVGGALADQVASPKLGVTNTPSGAATGVSTVSIQVTGGAPLLYGELSSSPELPNVSCAKASVLAPTWSHSAQVLLPFSNKKGSLACSVRLRGQEQAIAIPLRPPSPGAYATAPPRVLSTDQSVPVQVQLLDAKMRLRPPQSVAMRSSAGTPIVAKNGRIELALPKSNAPRMIAFAFAADGQLGALFVPVAGVTKLPVKTRVGAEVLIRIGGSQFGPIVATRKKFKPQIQVSPGVQLGVIRATNRSGRVREQVANLRTPSVAAVTAIFSHQELTVGNKAKLLVAYSSAAGRPAPMDSSIEVRAERGQIGKGRALSAGVWVFDYQAPTVAGPDSVVVTTPEAGQATGQLQVVAGIVSRMALGATKAPYRPAARVKIAVELSDKHGNAPRVDEVTATIGDEPASVKWVGESWELSGQIPKRLPSDGLVVMIKAGDISHSEVLPVEASESTSVQVNARIQGRRAVIQVAAEDRFGNPSKSMGIKVTASGARVELDNIGSELKAVVIAAAHTRSSKVEVQLAGKTLHSRVIEFSPPEGAVLLGGWVNAGYGTNLGDMEFPRLGVGASLRRGVGRFDIAFHTGLEGSRASGTQSLTLLGEQQMIERNVSWLGVPLLLCARYPISDRLGVHVSGGVMVRRAISEIVPDFQPANVSTETLVSLRAGLGFDAKLGAGWITISGEYDDGRLKQGVVQGRLGGAALLAGYRWWLADLGTL